MRKHFLKGLPITKSELIPLQIGWTVSAFDVIYSAMKKQNLFNKIDRSLLKNCVVCSHPSYTQILQRQFSFANRKICHNFFASRNQQISLPHTLIHQIQFHLPFFSIFIIPIKASHFISVQSPPFNISFRSQFSNSLATCCRGPLRDVTHSSNSWQFVIIVK